MSKKVKAQLITATHPGEILKDLLLMKEMSQKELAVTIGKTTPVVNDILCGRRDINVEIAVLLEVVFEGYPASFWLECQAKYNIEMIRQSEKMKTMEQSIKEWRSLDDFINLRIIKKRSGIGSDILKDLAFLRKLYNVDSLSSLQNSLDRTLESALFRKSDTLHNDSRNLKTWILLTRIANESQSISNPFNIERIDELVNRLNNIFYANTETLAQLKEVLNQFGIKFIHEKKLDKVPVDGYSFWLGDYPTIVVTTRYSWLDNLAFTVFHELGHIVYHLANDKDKDFLDVIEPSRDKIDDEYEKQADSFAVNSLRRGCDFISYFKRIENPFAIGSFIYRISETYSINESIVIGQYQHYCKTVLKHPAAYAIGAKFKQKIK